MDLHREALVIDNGLTETHAYSTRYLPTSISVPSLLSWTYATDSVGNPTVTITGGCNGGCLNFSSSGPISWAANTFDPRTGRQGQDFFNNRLDWPKPPKPPTNCCAPPSWK